MSSRKSREIRGKSNVERYQQLLACDLTPDEIASYADQAARAAELRDQKERAREDANKAAKAEIERLDTDLGEFLKKVRTRKETREVTCERRFIFEENVVRIVRLDTGEVVSERAMTYDERQVVMFPTAAAAAESE